MRTVILVVVSVAQPDYQLFAYALSPPKVSSGREFWVGLTSIFYSLYNYVCILLFILLPGFAKVYWHLDFYSNHPPCNIKSWDFSLKALSTHLL